MLWSCSRAMSVYQREITEDNEVPRRWWLWPTDRATPSWATTSFERWATASSLHQLRGWAATMGCHMVPTFFAWNWVKGIDYCENMQYPALDLCSFARYWQGWWSSCWMLLTKAPSIFMYLPVFRFCLPCDPKSWWRVWSGDAAAA